MKNLSIDIESYSSVNLAKSGVYRYAEAPDFEVLLFGYSADGAPVRVVDLTAGETLPADVCSALTDPAVTKWAFNAQFERVCLSRYLGYHFSDTALYFHDFRSLALSRISDNSSTEISLFILLKSISMVEIFFSFSFFSFSSSMGWVT